MTRRPRSARALARQAAREAARQSQLQAKAPEAAELPSAEPPLKLKPAAPKPVELQEEGPSRQQARGLVCPRCGKYHDITSREIGTTFECKCGRELYVAPVPESSGAVPAKVVIRMRELAQKRFWAVVGMILAYPIGLLLAYFTGHLLLRHSSYVSGTCLGIAAIAFLWAAVVSTLEYRRTSARIAEEESEQ